MRSEVSRNDFELFATANDKGRITRRIAREGKVLCCHIAGEVLKRTRNHHIGSRPSNGYIRITRRDGINKTTTTRATRKRPSRSSGLRWDILIDYRSSVDKTSIFYNITDDIGGRWIPLSVGHILISRYK